MRLPKFIVAKDKLSDEKYLLVGLVEFHFELLPKGYDCLGGGLLHINPSAKKISFYDKSYDFGYANLADIKEAFDNSKIDIEMCISMVLDFRGVYGEYELVRKSCIDDPSEDFIGKILVEPVNHPSLK